MLPRPKTSLLSLVFSSCHDNLQVRSRLREIVGGQAEGWTYQPVTLSASESAVASATSSISSSIICISILTAPQVDQQLVWQLAASSASSSSSRSSCPSSRGSGSTQSTAASSPSPRTLPSKPRGRLIENPLDSPYSAPLLPTPENIYHTINSHNSDRLIINKHLDIVKLGGE